MASHKQVAREFVAGKESMGSHFRSAPRPSGATVLYSYSTPIAFRTKDGEVFLTDRYFSTSTSIQKSHVKAAAPNLTVLPHEEFVARAKQAGADYSLAR